MIRLATGSTGAGGVGVVDRGVAAAWGRGGPGAREWAPDVGEEVEGEGVVFEGVVVAAKNDHERGVRGVGVVDRGV